MSHPNLTPEVNNAIDASERAWGFALSELPPDSRVNIQTVNTLYKLHLRRDGTSLKGNGTYCPHPTKVRINGCTFGGSMIKLGYLFEGGYLEFVVLDGPHKGKLVTTSQIRTIRVE